ncbi:CapA family protein [Streptomyces gobiensis]|uniref:CapA family protein n=1 Tax=Streptomyces gobiensis TaxID=2875706 RepID=UPI001E3CE34B|nr:CapA family protein [Streptomyces gobiensis]UGY90752.1 CapA family protein [Streptomyces gobiensis]
MAQHTRYGAALLAAALLTTVTGCGGSSPEDPATEQGAPKRGTPVARAAPAKGFTLVATGDILPHDSIIQQARADAGGGDSYDFRRMLAGAKPVVSKADLAICHMETVYGPDGGPFTGYPAFKTPPHIAQAIKDTGYHSCSTASNHTLDAGAAGVSRTLSAMDKAGLKHAGSARSAAERTRPAMLEAGDAQVAQLAYTYGTNGIPVAADKPWIVNLIDPDQIIKDARAARRAGADVVVVSMHWGTEWQEAPNRQQLKVARELTAARTDGRRDIDLILGTHAHVPQAYEKVNGTWVVYGMGDQIAGVMNDPRGSMGSAVRFTFAPPARDDEAWTVRKAEFIPHLMASSPRFDLVNLPRALADNPDRAEYVRARDTIRNAVLSRGAAKDGLTMGR